MSTTRILSGSSSDTQPTSNLTGTNQSTTSGVTGNDVFATNYTPIMTNDTTTTSTPATPYSTTCYPPNQVCTKDSIDCFVESVTCFLQDNKPVFFVTFVIVAMMAIFVIVTLIVICKKKCGKAKSVSAEPQKDNLNNSCKPNSKVKADKGSNCSESRAPCAVQEPSPYDEVGSPYELAQVPSEDVGEMGSPYELAKSPLTEDGVQRNRDLHSANTDSIYNNAEQVPDFVLNQSKPADSVSLCEEDAYADALTTRLVQASHPKPANVAVEVTGFKGNSGAWQTNDDNLYEDAITVKVENSGAFQGKVSSPVTSAPWDDRGFKKEHGSEEFEEQDEDITLFDNNLYGSAG